MRTTKRELHADAVDALLQALHEAGLDASPARDADLVVNTPAGVVLIEVAAASVLDADRIRAHLQSDEHAFADAGSGSRPMRVYVADQLSGDARAVLRQSESGYLDRRGALWLRTPNLIVNDTSLTPLGRRRPRPDAPIRGRVALGVALRRLMHPDADESVREIAAVVGAAPSTVHDALAQLRQAALIDAAGRPLIPDLFDVVADIWRPERIAVQREPQPGDRGLELGLSVAEGGAADEPGWVVAGDVGAAAAGARIVVSSSAPPDFYVPSQAELRRAIRVLGECSPDERGATVAVAPSPVVTADRYDAATLARSGLRWPLAHPVVIALDLAQDLSRGRELLDDWTPEGVRRVW